MLQPQSIRSQLNDMLHQNRVTTPNRNGRSSSNNNHNNNATNLKSYVTTNHPSEISNSASTTNMRQLLEDHASNHVNSLLTSAYYTPASTASIKYLTPENNTRNAASSAYSNQHYSIFNHNNNNITAAAASLLASQPSTELAYHLSSSYTDSSRREKQQQQQSSSTTTRPVRLSMNDGLLSQSSGSIRLPNQPPKHIVFRNVMRSSFSGSVEEQSQQLQQAHNINNIDQSSSSQIQSEQSTGAAIIDNTRHNNQQQQHSIDGSLVSSPTLPRISTFPNRKSRQLILNTSNSNNDAHMHSTSAVFTSSSSALTSSGNDSMQMPRIILSQQPSNDRKPSREQQSRQRSNDHSSQQNPSNDNNNNQANNHHLLEWLVGRSSSKDSEPISAIQLKQSLLDPPSKKPSPEGGEYTPTSSSSSSYSMSNSLFPPTKKRMSKSSSTQAIIIPDIIRDLATPDNNDSGAISQNTQDPLTPIRNNNASPINHIRHSSVKHKTISFTSQSTTPLPQSRFSLQMQSPPSIFKPATSANNDNSQTAEDELAKFKKVVVTATNTNTVKLNQHSLLTAPIDSSKSHHQHSLNYTQDSNIESTNNNNTDQYSTEHQEQGTAQYKLPALNKARRAQNRLQSWMNQSPADRTIHSDQNNSNTSYQQLNQSHEIHQASSQLVLVAAPPPPPPPRINQDSLPLTQVQPVVVCPPLILASPKQMKSAINSFPESSPSTFAQLHAKRMNKLNGTMITDEINESGTPSKVNNNNNNQTHIIQPATPDKSTNDSTPKTIHASSSSSSSSVQLLPSPQRASFLSTKGFPRMYQYQQNYYKQLPGTTTTNTANLNSSLPQPASPSPLGSTKLLDPEEINSTSSPGPIVIKKSIGFASSASTSQNNIMGLTFESASLQAMSEPTIDQNEHNGKQQIHNQHQAQQHQPSPSNYHLLHRKNQPSIIMHSPTLFSYSDNLNNSSDTHNGSSPSPSSSSPSIRILMSNNYPSSQNQMEYDSLIGEISSHSNRSSNNSHNNLSHSTPMITRQSIFERGAKNSDQSPSPSPSSMTTSKSNTSSASTILKSVLKRKQQQQLPGNSDASPSLGTAFGYADNSPSFQSRNQYNLSATDSFSEAEVTANDFINYPKTFSRRSFLKQRNDMSSNERGESFDFSSSPSSSQMSIQVQQSKSIVRSQKKKVTFQEKVLVVDLQTSLNSIVRLTKPSQSSSSKYNSTYSPGSQRKS